MNTFLVGCSEEFVKAFGELDHGKDVRRASWRVGMFLRTVEGKIEAFQSGSQQVTGWQGPSTDDAKAVDWIVT